MGRQELGRKIEMRTACHVLGPCCYQSWICTCRLTHEAHAVLSRTTSAPVLSTIGLQSWRAWTGTKSLRRDAMNWICGLRKVLMILWLLLGLSTSRSDIRQARHADMVLTSVAASRFLASDPKTDQTKCRLGPQIAFSGNILTVRVEH